jgi:hypothetical protein
VRTWLYVDGYNFYCSLRSGVSKWPIGLGWCNFRKLAEQHLLQPGDRLEKVRYFTSPVRAFERSKGEAARQRVWLAALRTICAPEDIKRGRHVGRVGVYREEKMTDVRIAVELILDGINPHGYEKALVLTSDQDLFPAVQAVHSHLPVSRQVEFVFSPDSNPYYLKRYCRAHKIHYSHIKPQMLLNSRFDADLKDPATGKKIACLPEWELPANLASQYPWARRSCHAYSPGN